MMDPGESDSSRRERGDTVRREVLGDEYVDHAEASSDEFTADFQDLAVRHAWGEVWDRPGLGRRERSIATLAVLVALRAESEIALHVRAALRNGLTPTEIKEVLLHTAVYAGVPAAKAAFSVAQGVIAEDG
jgi:4-carboxymuconolactone decarboxylase